MTPTLAVQLYTLRDALAVDTAGTLAAVADLGYTYVEPFQVDAWADPLAEAFTRHGLAARSTHADALEGAREAIIAACRRLGIRRVVQPSSSREQWTDPAAVTAWTARMNALAVELDDAGLVLAYHNHEFEIENEFDGRIALEVAADQLDPRIELQVDTYWAHVGGADVPALLGRLGARVTSIHLKDGDGTRDTSAQVAVGDGAVPVLDFLDAATAIEVGIVELDDSAGDMMTQVRRSRDYLTAERSWA